MFTQTLRKIFTFVWLLAGTIGVEGQSMESSFPWPKGKRMALSLSFDDARLSNVDVGLPLFKELETQVTFYVNPEPMKERMEGWKQAILDGHEIGNHSVIHPCSGNFTWARGKALDGYSLATMKQELDQASQQIEEMLGISPVSYAYPCGQMYVGRGKETRSYVPIVAELFESGRGWMNEVPNDPSYVDFAQLQGIKMDSKDFETEIKPILNNAQKTGGWVVLAGHEIGEGGFQTTRTQMLKELITYAKNPENGIWIAPVGTIAAFVQEKRKDWQNQLRESLRFATTFDKGWKADFAIGDSSLYLAPEIQKVEEGDTIAGRRIAQNQGRFGNALAFDQKAGPRLFFKADKNMGYSLEDWEGTISLWLSLDPEKELEPGYTDPIQISDVSYEDAALWVDFTDKNPRDFRMGVLGDKVAWNPKGLGPDDNPDFARRLVVAQNRPFAKGGWTHICITFSGLNTEDGKAQLYVNGLLQGETRVSDPFTWEEEKAIMFIGLNYVGLIDEIAVFGKAHPPEVIQNLYLLSGGLKSLVE